MSKFKECSTCGSRLYTHTEAFFDELDKTNVDNTEDPVFDAAWMKKMLELNKIDTTNCKRGCFICKECDMTNLCDACWNDILDELEYDND